MTHTDTSSADANITAATQILHTDTSSANANNITAATMSQLDTLSGPLQTHSPLWRALRRTRKRLRTVADGCGRLRTVANTETTFREHSLTPRPPNETRTLATHSGNIKNPMSRVRLTGFPIYSVTFSRLNEATSKLRPRNFSPIILFFCARICFSLFIASIFYCKVSLVCTFWAKWALKQPVAISCLLRRYPVQLDVCKGATDGRTTMDSSMVLKTLIKARSRVAQVSVSSSYCTSISANLVS